MSAPAFDQKAYLNLTEFQDERTLPSEEELKRQIEQLIKEDYPGTRGLSFGIIIGIASMIIIFGAIWLAWL